MYFSNRENPENLFKLVDIGQLLKNQFERKKLLLKRPNQVHLSKPVPKTEDMRSLLRESFANLNQIVNAKPKEHILASVVKMDDNKIVETTKYFASYLTKAQMISSRERMNIIKSPNEKSSVRQNSVPKARGKLLIIQPKSVQKDECKDRDSNDNCFRSQELEGLDPIAPYSGAGAGPVKKKSLGIGLTKILPSKRTVDFEDIMLPQDSKENYSIISAKLDPVRVEDSRVNSFAQLLEGSKAKGQDREKASSKILPGANSFQRVPNLSLIAPIIKKTRTVLPNLKSSKSVKFLDFEKSSGANSHHKTNFHSNKKHACCLFF